jgi:hypothetical protein
MSAEEQLEPRCDRTFPHRRHPYVATPRSDVDLECPGVRGRRTIADLLVEQPALAEIPAPGITLHVLGLMAA